MSGAAVAAPGGNPSMSALESALGELIQRAMENAVGSASHPPFEIEIRARVVVGRESRGARTQLRLVSDPYQAELRPEGGVWLVSFAGKKAHFKDFRGFRFLVELLRSPGREIHADDLVAAVDGESLPRAGRQGLEASAAEGAALPDAAGQARASSCTLQPQGDFWRVAFDGASFQVKDQKGLHYLRVLLNRPGQDVHVLDLLAAMGGRASAAVSAREALDLGLHAVGDERDSAADRRALEAYRRRLRELGAEIEEADARHDGARREALEREVELLEGELRGGRRGGFKAPPALERVRLNVSRALRAAQRHLGKRSPALERHLARALRTGRLCSYQPPPGTVVAWET